MQTETSDKWQSISKDYIAGEMRPAHKHSRAQLLYACEGVMLAATGQGRRIIAPFQALWIPAGIEHTITFLSATKMRSLYFDKAEYKDKKKNRFGETLGDVFDLCVFDLLLAVYRMIS